MKSLTFLLFLASKSPQRQELLTQAHIPFSLIEQNADERAIDWNVPFEQLLESIALHKMNHVLLPKGQEHEICFVLTVDTMLHDSRGMIYGKPKDKEEAKAFIQALRDYPGRVGTAFCLDKKRYNNGSWHLVDRIVRFVSATYVLAIPDHWIDIYLENYPDYTHIAGGLTIEGFGAQFLKSLHGSYSAALGLPLAEVREALIKLGFFELINDISQ